MLSLHNAASTKCLCHTERECQKLSCTKCSDAWIRWIFSSYLSHLCREFQEWLYSDADTEAELGQ